MWSEVDHRNVSIRIKWDNELFNDDLGIPLYLQFRRKQNSTPISEIRIKSICDGVQNRDLFMPLKNLLDDRQEKTPSETRSVYRYAICNIYAIKQNHTLHGGNAFFIT